jgi:hypothetical protein
MWVGFFKLRVSAKARWQKKTKTISFILTKAIILLNCQTVEKLN